MVRLGSFGMMVFMGLLCMAKLPLATMCCLVSLRSGGLTTTMASAFREISDAQVFG